MNFQGVDKINMNAADTSEYSKKSIVFYGMFDLQNSNALVLNVSSRFFLYSFGRDIFLVNQNDSNTNSYVSSMMSAYVTYPLDELSLIKDTKKRNSVFMALKVLKFVFRLIRIERAVFVGNFLVSTNFHPESLVENCDKIGKFLSEKFENDYVVLRSVNERRDAKLIESLKDNGWTLLPARMVYLFDNDKLEIRQKKNHYKKDMKLLRECEFDCVSNGFETKDFERMARLFELLYIEKHSEQNPKFSAKYIQKSYESGFCELYAYKKDSEIIAFIAILEMEGVISTHMLGYDTALPQELGLYRLLCAKLHSIANDRGLDINFSSGAGGFKSARGGEAVLEYTAVYTKVLPFYKRVIFEFLSRILNKQFKSFFEDNNL